MDAKNEFPPAETEVLGLTDFKGAAAGFSATGLEVCVGRTTPVDF